MFGQSATYWIGVDVLDDVYQRRRLSDVPVIAASGLPEQPFGFLAALARDAREPLGRLLLEKRDGLLSDRALISLRMSAMS